MIGFDEAPASRRTHMNRRETLWETIWYAGFTAQRTGRSRLHNPHPEGSDRWAVWDCAWADAAFGVHSPTWG